MKYQINEVLHSCFLDDETNRTHHQAWAVRSRRNGKYHAVALNEFTWVKAQWGTDQTRRWAEYIPPEFRRSCNIGEQFYGLFRTKKQAAVHARKCADERARRTNAVEREV